MAEGAAAIASDPITVARRAIEALAPFASVAVEGSDDVAGRPVYALVLTPSSDRTLVGSIELSIDAETRLPLRLQVFARGAEDAAVSAGFTSVSYAPIDPSVFAFSPPPGADVVDPIEDHRPLGRSGLMPGGSPAESQPQTRVFGEGFEPGSRSSSTSRACTAGPAAPVRGAVAFRGRGRSRLAALARAGRDAV